MFLCTRIAGVWEAADGAVSRWWYVRWPGDTLDVDLSKVICGNCGVVVYWVLVVGGGGVGED